MFVHTGGKILVALVVAVTLSTAPQAARADDPEPLREAWSQSYFAGQKAYDEGNYSLAEQHLKTALSSAEQGKYSGLVAQTLYNLARACQAQKKYEEAEPLYKRAIEIYASSEKSNRFHAIAAIKDYVAMLREINRPQDAAAVESGSLGIRIRR